MRFQMSDLKKELDDFIIKTKKIAYKRSDQAIKNGANRIKNDLPKPANLETLYSFADYKYSNNGKSRNLKFHIATKKQGGGYKFSAYLGDDQNLAHLFEDGFDLKQRHGYTHIDPLMKIDFEAESEAVANDIVKMMNREKGG